MEILFLIVMKELIKIVLELQFIVKILKVMQNYGKFLK